jgi:hypothetical protein
MGIIMSKKKGHWVKDGVGQIEVDGKVYTDDEWQKIRKRPKTPVILTEQQEKVKEVGEKIKETCSGLEGCEFGSCRSKILESVFKKK